MIRQKVTITNPTGLHLRPAGMFCNIASRYKCKVEFMYDEDVAANAKSVLSVLGACVNREMRSNLSATGKMKKRLWMHGQCNRRWIRRIREYWTACVKTQAF